MHDLACPLRAQGASVHGCEQPRFFNPIWPTSFGASAPISPITLISSPCGSTPSGSIKSGHSRRSSWPSPNSKQDPRCEVGKSETDWDYFRGLECQINVRCSEARADFSRAYNAIPARDWVPLHMRRPISRFTPDDHPWRPIRDRIGGAAHRSDSVVPPSMVALRSAGHRGPASANRFRVASIGTIGTVGFSRHDC